MNITAHQPARPSAHEPDRLPRPSVPAGWALVALIEALGLLGMVLSLRLPGWLLALASTAFVVSAILAMAAYVRSGGEAVEDLFR